MKSNNKKHNEILEYFNYDNSVLYSIELRLKNGNCIHFQLDDINQYNQAKIIKVVLECFNMFKTYDGYYEGLQKILDKKINNRIIHYIDLKELHGFYKIIVYNLKDLTFKDFDFEERQNFVSILCSYMYLNGSSFMNYTNKEKEFVELFFK